MQMKRWQSDKENLLANGTAVKSTKLFELTTHYYGSSPTPENFREAFLPFNNLPTAF